MELHDVICVCVYILALDGGGEKKTRETTIVAISLGGKVILGP